MENSSKSPPEVDAGKSQTGSMLKMFKSSHKKKKLIDPAAPKAPVNCFILYVNEHREAVKTEMEAAEGGPGTVKAPVLLSELGRRWRLLSNEERLKYENMFQQQVKEFETAKSNYKPSEEFLSMVKMREEKNLRKQKAKTKSSAKTPPGMMKAYFDFVSTSWMRVAMANQGMTPGELQKVIWSEWMGEAGVQPIKKAKKRIRSGEKRENIIVCGKTSDDSKIVEKDIDISSDPNPSVADDDAGSSYIPKKVAKVLKSPLSPVNYQSLISGQDCKSDPSLTVWQSPPDPMVTQSPPDGKSCKLTTTDGFQSPPSDEPVTMTKQEHHHDQEQAAYAFFQTQMTEELRRVCPHMGEEAMVKSVKEKWAEIPRVQKDIFFREIMQNQEPDTC